MKRNIKKATAKHYDLIIIGGGISGACAAWDASLRGLSCLLLEKKDFGHATSSATSKLIHGGLRYLKNFELSLVRESLSERRIFEIIAPHMVHPIPFLVPTYGHGMDSRLPLMAALTVYDVLGYDKRDLDDRDKRIPNHRFLPPERALKFAPGLRSEGLTGAAVYHDCQMQNPDRLTLEFILSAHEYGAEVLNYFEACNFVVTDDKISGVVARDVFTGKEYTFHSKIVANISGPWADLTLSSLNDRTDQSTSLIRSKGIHLVTRPLTNKYAIVFKTASDRHFFIIPWRGKSLIGTTDRKYEGAPDEFKVTETDIQNFIKEINQAYPPAQLTREDILYFYGGMRPIVDTQTEVEVYDASRRYEITDHEKEDGLKGLITILGGKYTTSRKLAKQIIDLVYSKLKLRSAECTTDSTSLMGGHMGSYKRYLENALEKDSSGLTRKQLKHIIQNYGSEYKKLVNMIKEEPELGKLVTPGRLICFAELVHALEHEMAMTLDDLIFRRTGLGTIGAIPEADLEKCAEFVGRKLKWSKKRIKEELAAVNDRYVALAKKTE